MTTQFDIGYWLVIVGSVSLAVFAGIVIKMFICWIIIKLIGFIKKLGKNFWRNILYGSIMREKDGYVSYTIFDLTGK